MGILLLCTACFMLYFLPAIAATYYGNQSATPIMLVNFFLGWTFIGWIVALLLAMKNLSCGQFLKALGFNAILFVAAFILLVVGV